MAQGLQCWDANGNLIFDSTVQTTYSLGVASTGTEKTGSLYDARLIGYDNQFWVQMITTPTEQSFFGFSTPAFSLQNGTLKWVHSEPSKFLSKFTKIENRVFMYGVY